VATAAAMSLLRRGPIGSVFVLAVGVAAAIGGIVVFAGAAKGSIAVRSTGAKGRRIPDCVELPPMFRLNEDYPREKFEQRITEDRREPWIVIGRCRECGQAWQVEKEDPHSRSPAFAIKIPDLATWSEAVERDIRVEYLRHARGGDAASGECAVAGCFRRPLKEMALCAEHAYDTRGVRQY